MNQERPVHDVPVLILLLLAVLLPLQIGFRMMQAPREANPVDLAAPPPLEHLQLLALGDPVALSRPLMLWLQAFDNQPGVSIPFQQIDYETLTGWLEVIQALDRHSGYPLFVASHLYGDITDSNHQRLMLEFVYRKFLEDPATRWPAMTHAVYLARHRLHDLSLALHYARALTDHAHAPGMPAWAAQMQFWVLEDLGEIEAAQILLGGLIANGAIREPGELAFLTQRLHALEQLSTTRK